MHITTKENFDLFFKGSSSQQKRKINLHNYSLMMEQ